MSTSSKKETRRPTLVGLTGGIGSGKSTIANIFRSLKVPVFNSDQEAKTIVNTDKTVIAQIKDQFGDVYDSEGINAEQMAQIVFGNKEALQRLNNIVHPKVREKLNSWIEANNEEPLLIQEAAILIESGAFKNVDQVILVTASEAERIRRVTLRDNLQEADVQKRVNAQLSDEEKLKHTDFVIHNDGQELVIPQVIKIYQQLTKKP